MTRHFCTHFDCHYATRGMALFNSLQAHVPSFRLYVLCLDQATFDLLRAHPHPALVAVALEELEAADPGLLAARPTRSRLEYYFTITPAWPRHLFARFAEIDLLTYLDADMFFFSDPEPVFAEIVEASVALTPHRPTGGSTSGYGRYNNGWMTFRRDSAGLGCLDWYRQSCLEWCYYRTEEDGRHADQGYLDQFAERFSGVVEIQHKGVNVAFYSANRYRFSAVRGRILVDDLPLVCYHFHSRWSERHGKYRYPLYGQAAQPDGVLRRLVYPRYHAQLARFEKQARPLLPAAAFAGSARP